MDAALMATSYLPNIGYSLLAIIIATLIALHYYIETKHEVRLSLKLPHPPRVPIIGHALISVNMKTEIMLTKMDELFAKHGSVLSVHAGTVVIVFLRNPQDIEIILSNPAHIDKSTEYRFFKPWFGDSVLTSNGAKWVTQRKTIATTFRMNILKTFMPLFYENSLDLVRQLNGKIGQQFNCHDYISVTTINILVETAMGISKEKIQNIGFDYAIAVNKLCEIIHRRHYDVLLRMDQLFKFSKFAKLQKKLLHTVHSLAEIVIQEKWKNIEEKQMKNTHKIEVENLTKSTEDDMSTTNYKLHYARDDLDDIDENDVGEKKRLAFLEMLIDMKKNGEQMTDEEIWDHVNSAMFGGQDTVSNTSSFVLCVLGCLPEIQARVHEELDSIFHDRNSQCTFEDTVKLKYLERVILETMRLFSPIPLIARKLNKDVKIVTGNYVLPKGATIVISPFMLHRIEEYYPNPLVFNPDNFLPEKMRQRHTYAYIPFSAGPRSCMGRKYAMLKLKVLLSTILRNYRITSDVSYRDFVMQAEVVLKMANGFNIKIETRKLESERNY